MASVRTPTSSPPLAVEPRDEHSSESRRNSTDSRFTYAKTWAEDVRNYHAAKSTLPWLPDQQKSVKHVTRFEKSREEREYDIVLGRFRDEDKEVGYQQRESSELKRQLEKGRAHQLRNIQRFHMISNAPLYPGAKDPTDKQPVAHPHRKKNAVEYNIVTNMPLDGTKTATTSGSPSRKPYREFNILTNKYHDRHDARFEQEAAQAKRIAAHKYFKTRTFDPVRITLVDEEREKEFLARRHEEQQIHGKDRVLFLPPREQFSEGRLYNILNQRVINPEKLVTMNEKDQRTLNKIKKTAFEKRMREEGENQQTRDTDLCLNRYAHERHIESHLHGYDVLSNQPYEGRDAKSIANPRTHEALTAWQTIESGLLVSNKVAPKTAIAKTSSNLTARDTCTAPNIAEQSSGAAQQPQPTNNQTTATRVRTGGF